MNLKREIKTLKGDTCPMSFPGKSDIDRVKEEKGITQVKVSDLPNETVGNLLINAIANYEVKDKKEVFELNAVALWAMAEEADRKELPKKLVDFIVNDILPQATVREVTTNEIGIDGAPKVVTKGLYSAWAIHQVYNEFGITQ